MLFRSSKIPSFHIKDLAEAMCPGIKTVEVGIRPGEKLDEIMVTTEDAPFTYEYDNALHRISSGYI